MSADATPENEFPRLLKPREVMDLLRIGKTKFYELYHAGELRGSRLGGGESDIRIVASSVVDMLERHANRKTPEATTTPASEPVAGTKPTAATSTPRRGRGRPRKTVRLADLIRYQPPGKRSDSHEARRAS
jgi:hypothetical protein